MLAGDLRYSRTIHSFVYALARFGANIVCVPQPRLRAARLRRAAPARGVRRRAACAPTPRAWATSPRESDAVYLTPQKPHQLSLFTDARGLAVDRVDARLHDAAADRAPRRGRAASGSYHAARASASCRPSPLRDAVVMHPLPRRDEISPDIDARPAQHLLQAGGARRPDPHGDPGASSPGASSSPASAGCTRRAPTRCAPAARILPNPTCISRTESRHVALLFRLASRFPVRAACGVLRPGSGGPLGGLLEERALPRPRLLGGAPHPARGSGALRRRARGAGGGVPPGGRSDARSLRAAWSPGAARGGAGAARTFVRYRSIRSWSLPTRRP